MDQCLEALIGLAGTHGDALELFEFTEEPLIEVPLLHSNTVARREIAAMMAEKLGRAAL